MRIELLHDLLEPIRPHRVIALLHAERRFDHQFPWIAPHDFCFAFLRETGKLRVTVVLVTVLHQQIAGRFSDTDTDDPLAVLFELENEAREIAVPREQDEGVDFGPREHEFECVDGEANIGSVLLVRSERRREDEIDRRFREWHDILWVATPISVRALHRHFALDNLGIEEFLELVLEIRPNPHRHIVKIDQ